MFIYTLLVILLFVVIGLTAWQRSDFQFPADSVRRRKKVSKIPEQDVFPPHLAGALHKAVEAGESLLSRTEAEIYSVVQRVVGDLYYVFPRMQLSHLLETKAQKKRLTGWQRWKMSGHTVDLVVCEKNTCKAVVAIQIINTDHYRQSEMEHDAFVVQSLDNAGIRTVRLASHWAGDINRLRAVVGEALCDHKLDQLKYRIVFPALVQ